ncbi:hypothetical protein C0J52_25163, partial [Blattella germanica]
KLFKELVIGIIVINLAQHVKCKDRERKPKEVLKSVIGRRRPIDRSRTKWTNVENDDSTKNIKANLYDIKKERQESKHRTQQQQYKQHLSLIYSFNSCTEPIKIRMWRTKQVEESGDQDLQFQTFAEQVMIHNLYWDFWYHGEDEVSKVSQEDENILYENKLIGVPRLRQMHFVGVNYLLNKTDLQFQYVLVHECRVKVRNDSCIVHEDFRRTFRSCYDFYSHKAEDKSTFGPGDSNALLFEIPPTGGIIPSFSIRTVKLLRYVKPYDYFVLGCEYIFVLFILFYTIEEIWEIIEAKLNYLVHPWNYLDFCILACAKDIGGFAIMFFIIFFAFAQLGYLLFGTQNMFLAIINDTYSDVKSEITAQKSVVILSFTSDNLVYHKIEMFFAKYDIDVDGPVREEDTNRMLTDMEGRRVSVTPTGEIAEPGMSQDYITISYKIQDVLGVEVRKQVQISKVIQMILLFNSTINTS